MERLDKVHAWPELLEMFLKLFPKFKNSKPFKVWFMANESDGKLFDWYLIARCYKAYISMHNKDRDHFMLIDGKEGSGKSTLAVQVAAWIDPKFCLENICFTPQDYISRLRVVQPGSVLVLDEGGVLVFSRETMTQNNISMTKLFMLQRQKNISVIVCVPSFWDIDSYLRRHRIDTMIRVIDQGKYMGILERGINIINDVGYRKRKISGIKLPTESFWHGSFIKDFPKSIDYELYKQRKSEHLDKFIDNLEADLSIDLNKPEMMQASKAAKRLDMTAHQMLRRIYRGTIEATKIGDRWFISTEYLDKLLGKGISGAEKGQ